LKKAFYMLVALIFLASAFCALYSARGIVAMIPGVNAGDWVEYDLSAGYNTTDPHPTLPPPPPDAKLVDYFRMEVESVVGTTINFKGTTHYTNGTETTFDGSVDLINPSTPMSSGMFFICANLTAGDPIYGTPNAAKINSTFERTYAAGLVTREVNCLVLNSQSTLPNNYTSRKSWQFLWDRLTGMALEIHMVQVENATSGYFTYSSIDLTMKKTNLWSSLPTETRTAGVKPGDWAKYDVYFNYSTNDPNPPIHFNPPFEELEYYKLGVESVVSGNVTYKTTAHYLNGTEFSTVGWVDVSSGAANYGLSTMGPIIGANLTAGDKVYLNQYSATLNSTETGIYVGAQRQVNCLIVNQSLVSQPQVSFMNNAARWDRISGIIVNLNESLTIFRGSPNLVTSVNIRLTMKETNIWAPTPTMTIKVFILPRAENLKSRGKWIMAIIELPRTVRAKDVDFSSIRINATIPIVGKPIIIGKRWLLVKFDRSEVIQYIFENTNLQRRRLTRIELTITGKLLNGQVFQGTDRIHALFPHRSAAGHNPTDHKKSDDVQFLRVKCVEAHAQR
jgi:hypothetical protein